MYNERGDQMKRYIKASSTSGMIGIWWYYNGHVLYDMKSIDDGYNDGSYISYDDVKNHSTEWRSVVTKFFPKEAKEIISKGYKGLERGRVIYNLRTQSYEVTCSNAIREYAEARKAIVDVFDLRGCRYDFIALNHYYLAELTGNPAVDDLNYNCD